MLLLVPTRGEAERLLDERRPLGERPRRVRLGPHEVTAALCGFGPAAAGVLAARALETARPGLCVLAGTAGTYDARRLGRGGVLRPHVVATGDVGRGAGRGFLGPAALAQEQAPGDEAAPAIRDRIDLPARPAVPDTVGGLLLTVAAASSGPDEARARQAAHPEALAEDMEGFAVALACLRAGVRLVVLRGVSNAVGEAPERWDREGALAAVRARLERLLARGASDPA